MSLTVPSSEDCTPLPAVAVVTPSASSVSGQAWVQPFAWVRCFPALFRGQHVQGLALAVDQDGAHSVDAFRADRGGGRREAAAGALLPGEPAAVPEDDEPHAAAVTAVPSARPPASSKLLSGPAHT